MVGALAGGLIGSQIGGGAGERVAAAVAGAAIGGLIGNRIGAALDDEDRQRAYEAQMDALDGARPVHRYPGATPIPAATATSCRALSITFRGMRCRSYTHTVYIDGRPQIARGTACRNPDGTWTPVA